MTTETQEKLFDVIEVSIKGNRVLNLMGENKTLRNAEAIVSMAVMRRGCDKSFYAEVPAGSYKIGEVYTR